MTLVVPRFWLPPDQALNLADAGFLPDPEDTLGGAYNPTLAAAPQLREIGCLVLLGEPGLGKSTALGAEANALRELVGDGPDRVLAVDLGATSQESVLRRRIFEAEDHLRWRNGDGVLHLLLDSLDEARIRIETIADLLLDGLDGADHDRLRLRLACRSADRHARLEATLRERFGEERFGVFELVPLRRRDVTAIAEDASVDPETFVREVIRRNLQPLASRPLALRLLLAAAGDEEGLPESVTEVYRRGCRLLAREPDEDRRSGSAAGRLDPGQRVAVASRIAAATLLAGPSAVLTDEEQPVSADDVSLDELVGGRELRDGAVANSFAVDEREVRETLGTGLFAGRGDDRLGFAHQTLGEFLAAQYLASHMRAEQVLDLLTLHEDGNRRIVPQLREVGSWLATLSPELFDALQDSDPDVLLRGDLTLADDEQRAALVRALLEGAAIGAVSHWDTRIRANLSGLAHPGIGEQIRSVLLNPAAPPLAREAAADLAGATRVADLADSLADLALGEGTSMRLRVSATEALRGWAPREALQRLRPLALEPVEDDEDDELRGAALRATWPALIDPDELFESLARPRRESLLGLYKSFLWNDVMAGLRDAALPRALRWARAQPRQHHPTDTLSDLVEQILLRGWEHRDEREVFAELVPLVLSFLCGGHDLLSHEERKRGEAFVERDGRRALVEALVPAVDNRSLPPAHVVLSTPPLLDSDDLPWLAERLREAAGSTLERGWAELIDATLGRSGIDLQLVMEAREHSAVLRELTASWFEPVEFASPEAQSSRERWKRWHAVAVDSDEDRAEVPDLPTVIAEDLDRSEGGDLDGFWHLVEHLALDPGARGHHRYFQSDLKNFPGWEASDADTRERIIVTAERYLLGREPEPERWFGGKTIWKPAWAAYRALRLLAEHAPGRLERLGREPWARWAPIVMSWPRNGDEEAETNEALAGLCFVVAPDEASYWFLRELDGSVVRNGSAWAVRRARYAKLTVVEEPLLERLTDDGWPAGARATLLQFLLERGSRRADERARELLSPELLDDPDGRELALELARVLVEDSPDAGWPAVSLLVEADEAFGRALFESVANTRERGVADRLDETQLADLFAWLEKRYPHAEDPELPDGVGHVGSREQIAWWRDGVVRGLANKGTDEAVRQLDRLEARFPELPWLGGLRTDAQELVRRARWSPPQPADVVRMGADAARRWVTSDAELREAVVESFARAQEALQSSTPASVDLWDTTAHRPKHENELSDWLKRWLDTDLRGRGVIVGREVQIRPGPGGKMGEAGDLVVEGIAGERVEGADIVSVMVEVKGCWHEEVDEAMRTQLTERYLLPDGHRQGVYVVGWYAADEWDGSDWRRPRCGRRSLQETCAFFETQAREVSAAIDVEIDAVVLDCSLPPRQGLARRQ